MYVCMYVCVFICLSLYHFPVTGGIDRMNPKTTEEFDAFREALKNKLQPLEVCDYKFISYIIN